MSIFKSIREMDQRFSWSFLGFMVAIIFGTVTVYIEFFKENKPDLNYVITANTSVLDIRENLGSLDVLYHGDSLSKNKKDLRLITFEVINQGDTSILSNFYDPNDPIGFSVDGGDIADEPSLVEASNEYLETRLAIVKRSDNSVVFSNVILEPGEYFKIKTLVLHEVSNEPVIASFGKVAGVKEIDVLSDYSSGNKRTFLEETFGGGVFPNLTRFISFGILFVLWFIVTMLTIEKFDDIKNVRKKRKLIRIFKEYDTDKISEKDDFFFDYYLDRGPRYIKLLYDLLGNQDKLESLAKGETDQRKFSSSKYYPIDNTPVFSELVSEGIVTVENESVTVDESRYSVLTDFYNFLKRKGEFRKGRDPYLLHRQMVIEAEEHNKLLKSDADLAPIKRTPKSN